MDYVQQDKLINIDFVAYSDYFYAFNTSAGMWCIAHLKMDANGTYRNAC
jgi:hypothetical protein